jgi:PAS domain S-box-containing protein
MSRFLAGRARVPFLVLLSGALEAAVSLSLGALDPRYASAAAALGILVAVGAGAVGGWSVGLLAAGIGWAFHVVFVTDEALPALAGLPGWLAAGGVAGWLALRLRRTSRHGKILAAVGDAAAEAIVGIGADGTIVSWNPGAEAIYGYTREEAEGEAISLLGAQRTRHKGGAELALSVSVVPIPDEAEGPVSEVLVAADVGAGRRLREAEARYRSLTEQLPVVTYLYPASQRSRPLHVSAQIEDLLGYSADEWLAQPDLFSRLLHPEDRERVLAETAAAAASGEPLRCDYRLLARDGRLVAVRDESATVRDDDGAPLWIQGHLLDVSERERLRAAERSAAAESGERQRQLDFLATASAILASSLDTDATLRRVAELSVRELADWCLFDLLDEEGVAVRAVAARTEPGVAEVGSEPDAAVLEVIRSGRLELEERRISAPLLARGRTLGAVTFVSTGSGRPYRADDAAVVQSVGLLAALALDDARLHAEVEERADAARVLTYVADAVILVDRAGVIRLWNPAAEAITGLSSAAVLGREAASSIPGWEALADRIPVGGVPDPVPPSTLPLETERGERWISISGVQFFGGTVYAFRDLTEDRRLEELKADFLATASHELRTPLAAVYGAAQTLRRHDFALDEAGRERFVALIVDESERLGRIVNEILLANQLELGRLELSREPFDPVDLVERVVEATRIHAPPGIELDSRPHGAIPSVAADRDKVRQVLMNLVENAIKYSPDGGRIELGIESADGYVRFHVRDEGLGIPLDEQARIFDKFYRLDPEMTRGVGGTGLGLYICSELVERMDGRIWVESREGEGSTFLFEIPSTPPTPRTLTPANQQSANA